MKLHRDGFVLKVVCLIGDQKVLLADQVNVCSIFWRFVAGLVLLVILNMLTWIALLVMGFLALLVRIGLFLCGKKMIRNGLPTTGWGFGVIIGAELCEEMMGKYYDVVNVEWMPTVRGIRIVPIYLILFAGIATASWFLAGEFVHMVALVSTGPYPHLRMMLLLLAISSVTGYILGKLGRRFAGSEAGMLMHTYLKGMKNRMCLMIDVVDSDDPNAGLK
jgi:hypothetical protein